MLRADHTAVHLEIDADLACRNSSYPNMLFCIFCLSCLLLLLDLWDDANASCPALT